MSFRSGPAALYQKRPLLAELPNLLSVLKEALSYPAAAGQPLASACWELTAKKD
jgi:hypothetical protein